MMPKQRRFPAEWEPQSAVQLTWPHIHTDWYANLEEARQCFLAIAREIVKHQKLVLVSKNPAYLATLFSDALRKQLIFLPIDSNDTWARDHAPLTVLENGRPHLLDFQFNGWGNKYPSDLDNQISVKMWESGRFKKECQWEDHRHLVLEGGAIESDGCGTLLTTASCLLHPNRNPAWSKAELEGYLQEHLGVQRILWLHHGFLAGDDTDGHIDTLARFCSPQQIAYVQCTDPEDEHFEALRLMEEELKQFKTLAGQAYDLIPLPMADPVWKEGEKLPATYANFLIINDVILLPFYQSPKDHLAKRILAKAFPQRKIIGIDCRPLIKQHGSLHCVTMQFPKGVF